jgi:hypothetical protein
MTNSVSFFYFTTIPEIIQLAVMLYVRFPLSLRNMEELLHERGLHVSYESVRYWWHKFGSQFASQIKKCRAGGLQSSNCKWHLDEVFVKINGERHYLWCAVDHEGEVLESYVNKKRDKKAALKFMKKLCVGLDRPMRSLQIGYDPTVQQQKSWAVQISKLMGDGQKTELRTHIYPFDDEKGPCFGLDACTVCRSSLQSMPRFTIYSTRKGHSQHAVHSNLTVT